MGKTKITKSLALLFVAMLLFAMPSVLNADLIARASQEEVLDNGSRIIALKEGTTYQWQVAESESGTFENIQDATGKYYDITTADEGKYLRVKVDGVASEQVVGPIGKLIVFDIGKKSVKLDASYDGKDSEGKDVKGTHVSSNIYVIKHKENAQKTGNNIEFSGSHKNAPFHVTLDNVNMGATPKNLNQAPGSGGSNTPSTGQISIPATQSGIKKVTLVLKGVNQVRNITYYNAGDTSTPQTISSSLKFTDINGDGASDGGALYVPYKMDTEEEINEFVTSKINYNHWNAGIGGTDGSSLVQNLHIAGGKIQVVTSLGDNCTAIGAGGNGYCQMEISGGEVIAHCNGTGAAIGGGIGWQAAGGRASVLISGGKVYAKNHGEIVNGSEIVGGVAIGSGSSFLAAGSQGQVTITGGSVEAYGTFGNGLGGGNSSTSTGGKATITISGGTVKATSIGGGNSKKGVGGEATVTISGTADVTLEKGIGGGTGGGTGDGGKATITVTGGEMDCAGVIGGGTGGATGSGGVAEINVEGGKLTAESIGGGTGGSTSGNGGAAAITVSGGVIETGSIGGGAAGNTIGKIGYATANISGGEIIGQFIMAAGGTDPCKFTMTGGTLSNVNTADSSKYTYSSENGAAVFMDDPNGVASISGGTIKDCAAENGGAIYMTAGKVEISGEAKIENCEATINGGAVYLGGGELTVNGGSVLNNSALQDGGAIYLGGGVLKVEGGSISKNAAQNGGGALVNGGNIIVTGGEITGNRAEINGGGIAVNNGNLEIAGGTITANKALTGNGGGAYVAAEGNTVKVDILSGTISNNTAAGNGGAVSVEGDIDGTEIIIVNVGVNELHLDENDNLMDGVLHACETVGHDHAVMTECPVITGNHSEISGGAVYVTGNTNTMMNIYCLSENENTSDGDKMQSNFMKMEGGKVLISTQNMKDTSDGNARYGYIDIAGSLYIIGGQMDLMGEMGNPKITGIITVDITKKDDYFNDDRTSGEYYKLTYYENFKDSVTNVTTGQYKQYNIKKGETITISGSIYSHPGYTISGWNTQADGTGSWYNVGANYVFGEDITGDLIIYAIWVAHGYKVVYDANVPTGVTYSGNMDSRDFNYGVNENLDWNQYGYVGHQFVQWNTRADGSGTNYANGASVLNLTDKEGVIVTLYAQWIVCNHDIETYSYDYVSIQSGRGLERTCSCKGFSETAVLSPKNTVYNRGQQPISIQYSGNSWGLSPTYTKLVEGNYVASDIPVNAGTYMAMITAGGQTATATYKIDKATQVAPNKPIYEAKIVTGSSITYTSELMIYPVGPSMSAAGDATYDGAAEYMLAYYVGDQRYETPWMRGNFQDGFDATFNLGIALTNYYIYARYSESANYYASPSIMADSIYFFAGDVQVHVKCGEGMDYRLNQATEGSGDQGIGLNAFSLPEYYIPKNFTIGMSAVSGGSIELVAEELYSDYRLRNIPASSIIYLTIPAAVKLPTLTTKVEGTDIFGDVTETETVLISRDSAFTVCFDIENYQETVFPRLSLATADDKELPEGTKIILIDKGNGKYYHHTVSSSAISVDLSEFELMGDSGKTGYHGYTDSLKLQFVVDFSEVQGGMQGDALQVQLVMYPNYEEQPNIRDNIVGSGQWVVFVNPAQFSLSSSGATGITQSITYEYQASAGSASIWDDRVTALILSPQPGTVLTPDARIRYVIGEDTTTIHANAEGLFIIPLSKPSSDLGNMSLTLLSNCFPKDATAYSMNVEWRMSETMAGGAPKNGLLLGSGPISITFTNEASSEISLKITGDKKLYGLGEMMNANVAWCNVPLGYEMTVTLMRKNDKGEYNSTGWSEKIVHGELSGTKPLDVTLGGQTAGSYSLHLTITNGFLNVDEVDYYFVIHEE